MILQRLAIILTGGFRDSERSCPDSTGAMANSLTYFHFHLSHLAQVAFEFIIAGAKSLFGPSWLRLGSEGLPCGSNEGEVRR